MKINLKKPNFSFLISHFSFALATAVALSLLNPAVANANFDESKPYTPVDVAQQYLEDHDYHDLEYYISKSGHWTFGEEFNHYGYTEKALTLDARYKYNKLTGAIGEVTTDDANKGDVIFKLNGSNNGNSYDNTPYLGNKVRGKIGSYQADGMHVFQYTPPDGTPLIVSYWRNMGLFYADHHDNASIWEKGEATLIANQGRWSKWCGVEFHSSRTDIPMQLAYEITSPCRNKNWSGESMIDYWNRNNIGQIPYCTICSEPLYWMFTYSPTVATQDLPVLQQGQKIVLTCSWCGGLCESF